MSEAPKTRWISSRSMDGDYGPAIRHFRKQKGLTVAELATRIKGAKPSEIEAMEKGECSPDVEELDILCEALEITQGDLLTHISPGTRGLKAISEALDD